MKTSEWIPDFKVDIKCNGETPSVEVSPADGNQYVVSAPAKAQMDGNVLKFAFVGRKDGDDRPFTVELNSDGTGGITFPGHNNKSQFYTRDVSLAGG